ncbi:MAG: hypothetical protein D6694_03045 [Gammaproteobacteria bacterium]|nr:MAG: hypothetical protein D6694_03045 [Gammaproteobacteria bacterium]
MKTFRDTPRSIQKRHGRATIKAGMRRLLLVVVLFVGVYTPALSHWSLRARAAELEQPGSETLFRVHLSQSADEQPPPQVTAQPLSNEEPLGDAFLSAYDRLAQNEKEQTSSPSNTGSNNIGNWTGVALFFLLTVVGLIYGGVAFMKRYSIRFSGNLGTGSGLFSLQESYAIGPNQKIHLVRMGEELLLIGATDHHVALLARLDPDELPESFGTHLRKAKQNPGSANSTQPFDVPSQLRLNLGDRLQDLRSLRSLGRGEGGND